jgi:hypothetical protein
VAAPHRPFAEEVSHEATEIKQEAGSTTVPLRDFGWSEDPVPFWTAVALFGAILAGLGGIAPGLLNPGPNLGILVTIAGGILMLGAAVPVLVGYAEGAVAVFASGVVAACLGVFYPWVPAPGAWHAVWTQPGSYGPDLFCVLALIVGGGAILGVGTVRALAAYRNAADED